MAANLKRLLHAKTKTISITLEQFVEYNCTLAQRVAAASTCSASTVYGGGGRPRLQPCAEHEPAAARRKRPHGRPPFQSSRIACAQKFSPHQCAGLWRAWGRPLITLCVVCTLVPDLSICSRNDTSSARPTTLPANSMLRGSLTLALATVAMGDGPTVLVTGATGGTGKLLYAQLKADPRVAAVRALVRPGPGSKEKAKDALNCTACDDSEGVYYGDVTIPTTLQPAFHGVDTVAIVVGVGFGANQTVQKAVEFTGVENQVSALATADSSVALADRRVVLCSSMATTNPHPLPFEGGSVLFWKLNAEAFLGASGIGNTIVKPCGIEGKYGRGGKELLVGHDDQLSILGATSRADVAAVMAEAVVQRAAGLRFDLCVGNGAPTTDLAALLEAARWPWLE